MRPSLGQAPRGGRCMARGKPWRRVVLVGRHRSWLEAGRHGGLEPGGGGGGGGDRGARRAAQEGKLRPHWFT